MSEFEIRSVRAREILDCRLEPTLQVTVETNGGYSGRADVPVGRSTGRYEAVERRDGGNRFRGKGVRTAVETVETRIGPEVSGMDVREQRALDRSLSECDGTDRMSSLGANATTGTSLAILRAAADGMGVPLHRWVARVAEVDGQHLPVPHLDVIEGGELGATGLAFQEHQLLPVGACSFHDAIRMGSEVYHELGDLLSAQYGAHSRNVGDEGGYTPPGLDDPREAFDVMLRAVEACRYGDSFVLGIDAAATHLYDVDSERYELQGEALTGAELLDRYVGLAETYPLASIEDPLHQDDFSGTAEITRRLECQVVGDDLFVTDPERVSRGVEEGAANALLLKVNQVGTVTDAFDAARIARDHGYAIEVSERSGQTADTWLADVAVGLGAEQIKTGVTRGERTAQFNRLLEIEAELGDAGTFGSDRLVS